MIAKRYLLQMLSKIRPLDVLFSSFLYENGSDVEVDILQGDEYLFSVRLSIFRVVLYLSKILELLFCKVNIAFLSCDILDNAISWLCEVCLI